MRVKLIGCEEDVDRFHLGEAAFRLWAAVNTEVNV
jgi:hypothetical protein